ncbi:DUF2993 domain-containing protein [soil metagenome]
MRGFVVFVLVLLGVLLAVDRIGVLVAEDRVAAELRAELELTEDPEVSINGFPVLDQAIAGRYRDVELSLADADLGELSGLDVVVRLNGVRIPLSELFAEIAAVPVDVLTGTVTVPYPTVAAQLGPGATLSNSPEGVVVGNSFDILGQQQSIEGTGDVTVDGGDVVVTVVGLQLNEIELDESVLAELLEQLSFRYPVPGLPLGLRITDVVATDEGFEVSGRATDLVRDAESIETG